MEPLGGNDERDLLIISIAHDLAFEKSAFDIIAFCLFRKDERQTHFSGADRRKRYAARFNGHDRGDLTPTEVRFDLLGKLTQKHNIHTMVEKSIDLDNTSGKHLALLGYSVL